MMDVYNYDELIIRNGLTVRPVKYYDTIYDDHQPERFKQIKAERRRKAKELPEEDWERLMVKEKLKKLQIKKLRREIE